jgi:uncharacterized protein (UPF0332 family)
LDKEFWDNFIKNVLETWVVPELNRREKKNAVPSDFRLYAVQIVMEPGVARAEIRLNEEVEVAIGVADGSPLSSGDVGTVRDFSSLYPFITSFDLGPDDRPNAGHITLIKNGTGWFAAFDLRYNAQRIAEHVNTAREFLDAAKAALVADRVRVFCADGFTAVELLAKARLLMHPDERLLKSKKHNFVISNYNLQARRGNVDPQFADLLNQLDNLRNLARYPVGSFAIDSTHAHALADRAEDMYSEVVRLIPERAKRLVAVMPSSANGPSSGTMEANSDGG